MKHNLQDAARDHAKLVPCPLCGHAGHYAFLGHDLLHGLPGEYVYAECGNCRAVYQSPLPTPEQIAGYYPESYEQYQREKAKAKNRFELAVLRRYFAYRHLPDEVPGWLLPLLALFYGRDAITFQEGGRLLDIGCGNGKYLQSMRGLGWQVQGVEFNAQAAAVCRSAGLEVFTGELVEAAFPDHSFAVVTARHLLEHLVDPGAFLSEIFRILEPGGRLLIKTPNTDSLARGWFQEKWYPYDAPRHLILYNPDNLQQLAESLGYRVVGSRNHTSVKCLLNSWDYLRDHSGKPSRRRRLPRLLAKLYVLAAALSGRGDELNLELIKPCDAGV